MSDPDESKSAAHEAMFGACDPHEAEMLAAIAEMPNEAENVDTEAADDSVQAERGRRKVAYNESLRVVDDARANRRMVLAAMQPDDSLHALDAAEEVLRRAEATSQAASLPAWDDHLAWILEAVSQAEEAICEWITWHRQRATQRMTPGRLALDALRDATFAVCSLFDGTKPDCESDDDEYGGYFPTAEARNEAMDVALSNLHDAISAAKEAAETARFPRSRADVQVRDDQAIELETSHIHGWVQVLSEIDYFYRQAVAAPADALHWRIETLRALSPHRCPPTIRWFQ